jgi:uncharacterized SAM-binding protein YcdF (DUF218 family)
VDDGVDRMTRVGVVALAVLTGFAAFVLNMLPTGYPLVTCAALAAALILIRRLQHRVLSAVAVVVAIACVVATGTPLPGVVANRLTERCTAGPSDAIIVLEGDAGQDRIIHALRIFRQKWAPLLIVTGTSSLPDGWRYFETATLFGLRADQLRRVEVRRGGTYGEALALHEDAFGQRLHRVILVTSPAHSARAANVFRKFGYTVCSMPSPAHSAEPDAWGRINLVRQLIRETTAWAYYKLRAWA